MKSILIIRPSAIGDIVMASPMIRVLRRSYPRARIAWLVEPNLGDLLRHNPALDEVIVWDKSRWKRLLRSGRLVALLREVRLFREELRRHRFQLALDAQGLFRSRLLSWLSGATERVGLDSGEPGKFLMGKIVSRGENIKRISSEYYHLMETLGLCVDDFRMDVAVSSKAEQAGREKVQEAGIDGAYAVFCPFTTRPQKHWFEDRWAKLAVALHEQTALPVVLLGGPEDFEAGRRIQSQAQGRVRAMTGLTTLEQSAAIVKSAHLVIGVDTGLTHMGIAFDRPTIAIFGATCPYLDTGTPNAVVLYEKLPCSPCKRSPTCQGDFRCMKLIDLERVLHTAREMLEKRNVYSMGNP